MKKRPAYFLSVVSFAVGMLLSSCATRSSEEQWKSDQTRYEQQLKRYPDRESSEQEKGGR
ncbi:MAG: hypothetical protein ABIZ04_09970 [Opitutus sp.]